MGAFIDLTGRRFGRLVVVERAGRNGRKKTLWRAACDCGNFAVVEAYKMKTGETSSCGCLRKECSARHMQRVGLATRKPDDEICYVAAHARVKRAMGSASTHACVDCGNQAQDWSLKAEPQVKMRGPVSAARVGYLDYSPLPQDYEPRCRLCHRSHDMAIR